MVLLREKNATKINWWKSKNVSGDVRIKIYKGSAVVVGRSSKQSLYSLEHVTFEEDSVYDQADAEGFIKINALRLRLSNKD